MLTSNTNIAHLLRSISAVYQLKNVNRFRIIAYEEAADSIENLNREIYDVWQDGGLKNISGIGASIAEHLDEYFNTKGSEKSYIMKTIGSFPPAMYEFMKIPGIAAKRAYTLSKELDIKESSNAVNNLMQAAEEGKIAELEGFGKKSENAIIESIELFKKRSVQEKRMLLSHAQSIADEITSHMLRNTYVKNVEVLGSLRRKVATIGDIDIAVICDESNIKNVIDHFIAFPLTVSIEGRGEKKASIYVTNGKKIDMRVADIKTYGSMLQYFTGSKMHNIKLREYARKKGYSLSEYGIKDLKSQKVNTFENEKDFYTFLKMHHIPPEIREGTCEIEDAVKGNLPKLVDEKDIKGDLQIHSNYDLEPSHDVGESSIEDIIQHARSLSYDYIAITDHNPSVSRHTEEQIVDIMKKRWEYFTRYRNKYNIIVSCEVDILPDGNLALPEEALDYVDMILVSIHSSFRMDRDRMTKRILKALTSKKVKVLAHPTGRLLQKREEIEADWNKIFKECARRNIAVEINGTPERLDLPDSLVREVKKYGIKYTLGTDAHSAYQMNNMCYAVYVARRGWLSKSDIINTGNFQKVMSFIHSK